ncbi:hypothetical protein NLC82_04330 [Candidatus Aminicenantes bacterium AC-335-A11]|jgi:hypothetical protein|nr:hypothetical protein [SCandidatus Aminicenantes bacterium Aminicenantia_JdfR_composite]MCP2618629.1 hypothetical protein [Candidatus Aminicenantes bacterium AC-335-A11]MCP2620970.1 hypothetical protein [Candidatus Aminicenantes bacterium AC-334-E05]
MRKIIFCSLVILVVAWGLVNCKNRVTGPEEPDTIELYDYELTYTRTEINNVRDSDPRYGSLQVKGGATWHISLIKINELKFKGIIRQLPTNMRRKYKPNWIYVVDPRRWRKVIKMPNNQVRVFLNL